MTPTSRSQIAGRITGRPVGWLVVAGVVAVLAGCAAPVGGDPVVAWVQAAAAPVATVDPAAPLDDLAPLSPALENAEIVGLGESTHGAAEEITLKHRTLRFLVERMGFRSLAWEEDWTVGVQIDDYLRTGHGNLGVLVSQMSPQWQSREVADALGWLRDYNAHQRDPAAQVRFVGVEYYLTRALAYDAVESYIARIAPERLPELRADLQPLRPSTPDIWAHVQAVMAAPDKQAAVSHARRVRALIDQLPHAVGDPDHALALHHAEHILAFYEHYALPGPDALVYRDAHAAENLAWWRDHHPGKIVYWAASPHTAVAPNLRIAMPPGPDMRFPSAGAHLRERYGPRYRSVGFTFDHGTVDLGQGQTATLPPPAPHWFEHRLAAAGHDQFVLDLHRAGPPAVRAWLDGPASTRGMAQAGPTSFIDGGSVSTWFDVLVHRQQISPTRPT